MLEDVQQAASALEEHVTREADSRPPWQNLLRRSKSRWDEKTVRVSVHGVRQSALDVLNSSNHSEIDRNLRFEEYKSEVHKAERAAGEAASFIQRLRTKRLGHRFRAATECHRRSSSELSSSDEEWVEDDQEPRQGECKSWDTARSFGCIAMSDGDGSQDVSVHLKDTLSGKHLEPGDKVEFHLMRNAKGRVKAVRVMRVARVKAEYRGSAILPLQTQLNQLHSFLSKHARLLPGQRGESDAPDQIWVRRRALTLRRPGLRTSGLRQAAMMATSREPAARTQPPREPRAAAPSPLRHEQPRPALVNSDKNRRSNRLRRSQLLRFHVLVTAAERAEHERRSSLSQSRFLERSSFSSEAGVPERDIC